MCVYIGLDYDLFAMCVFVLQPSSSIRDKTMYSFIKVIILLYSYLILKKINEHITDS